MLFIPEGLRVGLWNPDVNQALSYLEDEAVYPTLTTQSSF